MIITSCFLPLEKSGGNLQNNRSFKQKFGAILLQVSLHIILYRRGKAYKAAVTEVKEKKAIVERISRK